MDNQKPIGLLDSGLGGLSVYQEIKRQLPKEQVIYFGDSIHAPYGEKTEEQIREYTFSMIDFLIQQQVKMIIIACNTATTTVTDEIEKSSLPIIGVIQPGADEATKKTKSKRVGIIGTEVTVRNQSYNRVIQKIDPSITIFSNACSNQIIRLMEQGLINNETQILIQNCIKTVTANKIDTLVLGCTHYPFLIEFVKQVIGSNIRLVDPSEATVRLAKDLLVKNHLENISSVHTDQFFISGDPLLFEKVAIKLLGFSPGTFHKGIL